MPRKVKSSGVRPSFPRIGGFAAAGFAAMIVLGNIVLVPAGLPRTGADTATVLTFFATQETAVGVATTFAPIAWVLATLFGASVVSVLWRPERERGEAWSLVGLAGLVLQNGAFAAVVALRLALASTAGTDGSSVAGLWALHDALFTLNGTFLALALTGLSVGGLRAGLIRAWHGRLGLLAGALLFASATAAPLVTDHEGPLGLLGLVGWLLWVVWTLVYAVVLIRLPSAREATDVSVVRTAR